MRAVEGPIVAGDFGDPHQDGSCGHEGQCVLLHVWADVGEMMRSYLDALSLADMADRARGRSIVTVADAPPSQVSGLGVSVVQP